MKKLKLNPTKRDLRMFGLVLIIGFGLIGALLYYKGKANIAIGLWSIAGAIALLAFVWPSGARPFYVAWMTLGLIMGFVMSRVVMTLIFYGVITPVALFFRVSGRDSLKLKKTQAGSYWEAHESIEDKEYYEHLF